MATLLTAQELAPAFRRSVDSIYRDSKAGKIPSHRVGPRGRLLFDIDQVKAALRPAARPKD